MPHRVLTAADPEAERALLAAIVDQIPVAVAMVNARTPELVMANAMAARLLGLDDHPEGGFSVLGPRHGFREDGSPYGPDDWPIVRSLATGETVEHERADVVRPDDSRVELEISSVPVRDRSGAIVAAVSFFEDLASRRQRESAERQFVSNAAHELRTPLAAIVGAVEVLQSGAKDDPGAREQFLAHIEREAERLQRLVRALLTLARAQMGAEPPRLEVVQLLPILAEAVTMVVPTTAHVEVDCDPRLAALANADLIERVVVNLLQNAVHHTTRKVELRARQEDEGLVEIAVIDSGPGVSPDEREQIFERFFRAGRRDGEGFGLGLAIVGESVRALGGSIVVDSPAGGGTSIRVRLRGATLVAP
jgi:signal transduction histidine kinase